MPKANDFVCTLAPLKNSMVSNNHKQLYNSTSWLDKVFGSLSEFGKNNILVGLLIKVRGVLSAKKKRKRKKRRGAGV